MHLETFRLKYMIDFDEKLHEYNNEFVNSDAYYLEYKNIYLSNTEINYENLEKCLELLAQSTNIHVREDQIKKYTFTYVDKSIKERINLQIKELIVNQNKLYNDFINHIKFLKSIS